MNFKLLIPILLLMLLLTAVECNNGDTAMIFYFQNNSSKDLIINTYPSRTSSNPLEVNVNNKVFFESMSETVKDPKGFLDFYDSVIVKSANDGSVLLKYINNNDPSDNEFWQVDNWEEVAIDGDIYEYTYEYTFTIDDDDF